MILGYLVGHLMQPLVGFITKVAENSYGNEPLYAKAKREHASQSMLRAYPKTPAVRSATSAN